MTAGLEVLTAQRWLTTLLAGDLTLTTLLADGAGGVHAERIPTDAALPAVVTVFNADSAIGGLVTGTDVIASSMLFVVKGVAEATSYVPLEGIAGQLEALVSSSVNVTNSSGTVYGAVRQATIAYAELAAGIEYRHLGGLYRLTVS